LNQAGWRKLPGFFIVYRLLPHTANKRIGFFQLMRIAVIQWAFQCAFQSYFTCSQSRVNQTLRKPVQALGAVQRFCRCQTCRESDVKL
jgi:hypothetical protein